MRVERAEYIFKVLFLASSTTKLHNFEKKASIKKTVLNDLRTERAEYIFKVLF